MLKGFFNKTIDLKRKTDILVDWESILSLIELQRQPQEEINLVVQLRDAVSGGTVIITGTVNGTTNISENFLFSLSSQARQSLKKFTVVSGITSIGLSEGEIKIKACRTGGGPIYQELLISSGMKILLDSELKKVEGLEFGIPGGFTELHYHLMCSKNDGEKIQEMDILSEDNLNRYEVKRLVSFSRGKKIHHWEGIVKKL